MSRTTRNGLPIAFLLSFLAVGVPYWLIPYSKLNLPSALMEPGLCVVIGAALILQLRGAASFWKIVTMVGIAVPAAVFARVVWDGLSDPTSHNLWPIEIIIALSLGFSCAVVGAVAGKLFSLASRRTSGKES
jgi:hypothetical protein